MPDRYRTTTVRLRRLAAELRKLRGEAGLSREDVVESTGINVATLYRIEHARVRPQPRTLRTLLDTYGVGEVRQAELLALSREAAQRGWPHAYRPELSETYRTYIGFEDEARAVWNYEALLVPGLLQTEDYARAVVRGGLPEAGDDEVQSRVEARMARQAVLTRTNPVRLWAIVDEAALRRRVGGQAVMSAQLHRLIKAAEVPTITLQVISFDVGAHPGMPGAFAILKFPDDEDPDVVYVDSMATGFFVEDDAAIQWYANMYEHLRAVALSPADSLTLLDGIAEVS